jgi:tetratricopeptide (TPR) repeat protein
MLDPEDPTIEAQLGLALLDAGSVDAAIKSLRASLKRREVLEHKVGLPGVAIVYGHLGAALARKGQAGEALVQFDTSLRLDSENAAVYRERGILLEREGRETEAIASYRGALNYGDRSAALLNNLAWLLVSARESGVRAPAEAVRLAEEAAQLTDRLEPSILDTLSVALEAAGRPRARKVALEALALAEARGDVALARSIRDRIGSAPGG